jgi:hypothetical protein
MLTLQADACYPPEGILKDPEGPGGCCTFGHFPGRVLHGVGRVLHILMFFWVLPGGYCTLWVCDDEFVHH